MRRIDALGRAMESCRMLWTFIALTLTLAAPASAQRILTEPEAPCPRLAAALAAEHVSPPWYPIVPALSRIADDGEMGACAAAFDLVLRVEGPLAPYEPACAAALLVLQDAAGSGTLDRRMFGRIVAAAATGATAICREVRR